MGVQPAQMDLIAGFQNHYLENDAMHQLVTG